MPAGKHRFSISIEHWPPSFIDHSSSISIVDHQSIISHHSSKKKCQQSSSSSSSKININLFFWVCLSGDKPSKHPFLKNTTCLWSVEQLKDFSGEAWNHVIFPILPPMNLYMDVSKNRVFPPKWMVYNGNPYFLMDDLGVPLFSETSIYLMELNTIQCFSIQIYPGSPRPNKECF